MSLHPRPIIRPLRCWNGTGSATGLGRLIEDCLEILRRARHSAGGPMLIEWHGERCDLAADPEVLSCADAFHRYAGIELAAVAGNRDALAEGGTVSSRAGV